VNRRAPRTRRRQAGFTLIELLMGIILSSVFALAL
jgi:prepilin-type N-terminal cleavage/methylation domain-containing protein